MIHSCKVNAPEWVVAMVHGVCKHINSERIPQWVTQWRAPTRRQPRWSVSIHPPAMQVKGGPDDGAIVAPTSRVNLMAIVAQFDASRCAQVEIKSGQIGEIVVSGQYKGNPVDFYVLAAAPTEAIVEYTVDAKTNTISPKKQRGLDVSNPNS